MSAEGAFANAPAHGLRSRRLIASVPILLATLAIPLAGCGESKQEQAKKSVCSARSDINSRITTLKAITPSVATLPQIKTEVTAIVDDLKRIKGAQGDLQPARKQQVQRATQTFEQQLKSVLSNLASSLSLTNAASQLEAARKQLETSYAQALAPIECG
jgi:hypothetical protein